MKQLYDDNFGTSGKFYRTLWYTFMDPELSQEFIDAAVETIRKDLANPPEDTPYSTSWIFYGESQNDDAIGDKVRSSLMIREQEGKFVGNYNMSDYEFVTAFDKIESFKNNLLEKLNK